MVLRGPDGRDYKNKSVYEKIIKPELIVLNHITGPVFKMTAIFKKYGDKTRLTMHMEFENAKAYESAMNEFGAKEGMKQTVNRLEQYLKSA